MNRRATQTLARKIAHRLQHSNGGIVLLHGAMGAGKTTLVGDIVRILCPEALPASPTYTIINQYAENIFHADLYRLWENEHQTWDAVMQGTGLADLCVPGNYVFIEWPNDLQLPGAIHITIKIKEDGNREFIIAG